MSSNFLEDEIMQDLSSFQGAVFPGQFSTFLKCVETRSGYRLFAPFVSGSRTFRARKIKKKNMWIMYIKKAYYCV
jgi:hypothetical protein